MAERVPTDIVGDDLLATYNRGIRRLERLVEQALSRGLDPHRAGTAAQRRGDATAAYRNRQLAEARSIVRELERLGPRAGPVAVGNAYGATLATVDRMGLGIGAAGTRGQFGGVHQRAVGAMAGNLSASLERAATNMGTNLEAVFARMAELDGGLTPDRGLGFIGRRIDDPWRRVALEELGGGLVTADTRRQMTKQMVDRLIREGVTDALTGFVDVAGKRWPLDVYAEMVTRTTTREATSRATVNRLLEHGLGLVTISSHPHANDICTPYDGHTFALPEASPEERAAHPELDRLAPFHPRCRHVVTPAGASLDDFERELGINAAEAAGKAPPPPSAPATPPLAGSAKANLTPGDPHRAGPALDQAAELVDRVHRTPEMPDIPFNVGHIKDRNALAIYRHHSPMNTTNPGQSLEIRAKPGATPDLIIHEMGHRLDHKGLYGDSTELASAAAARHPEAFPDFAEFLAELEQTGPIRRIRESLQTGRLKLPDGSFVNAKPIRKTLKYLVEPWEIFARSYESWIMRESGAGLAERHIKGRGIEYWDDADYARIKAAIEKLFKARGLL